MSSLRGSRAGGARRRCGSRSSRARRGEGRGTRTARRRLNDYCARAWRFALGRATHPFRAPRRAEPSTHSALRAGTRAWRFSEYRKPPGTSFNNQCGQVARRSLPFGDEEVGFAFDAASAVGGEDEEFSVGGEHGEAVEALRGRDALEVRAVDVDREEVEVARARLRDEVVAHEDDALVPGEEVRRPVRLAARGQLTLVAAVGVRDVDLERGGAHEPVAQELAEVRFLLRALRGIELGPAPDDVLAVVAEVRAAVVARLVGQLLQVAALQVAAP